MISKTNNQPPRLVRLTTVPVSMRVLLKGQVLFMKKSGFEVFMVSSSGADVRMLEEQEETSLIKVPFTRRITPLVDLYALIRLIIIFLKLRPQIVHSHTPKAGLLAMWASYICRVPIRLHTIAGLPWMESRGIKRRILKSFEKLTAFASTGIFPNSVSLAGFLRSEKIGVGKIKVIGRGSSNGVDLDFFRLSDEIKSKSLSLRRGLSMSDEDWVWVFVGRIVKDKGVEELLDAFSILQRDHPRDHLWLIGEEEEDLDPVSERHRKIMNGIPNIRCWGFQEDIRPFLAASQVLVFPSYREGFPNVPLQAGLMGCMLILSDINGCNEIVKNMDNGILVPPKNTQKLAESMLFIRSRDSLRHDFSEKAKMMIMRDFSRSEVQRLILDEYKTRLQSCRLSYPK